MMTKRKSLMILFALISAFVLSITAYAAADIINGDFESGIDSWEVIAYENKGYSVDSSVDSSKGNVAHIVSENDNDVRLVQDIEVEGNTSYRITCYVKTNSVEGGAGANIGIYGVSISSEAVLGDSDWQLVELVGKTVDNQNSIRLSIGIGSHNALSKGEAWFDDVRIEEVEDAAILFGKQTEAKSDAITSNDAAPTSFPSQQILTGSAIAFILTVLIWLWHSTEAKKPFKKNEKNGWLWIALILAAAFIVRILLSLEFYGHKTDINCFIYWGKRVVANGPAHFYDQWCDYPPGYMLVLGAMSILDSIVGGGSADMTAIIIKLPCIIADLLMAYLVYRYAKRTMRRSAALALMALVAFTPVMAFVSSAWGQIDQALSLALVIPILLLYSRRPVLAGLVYGIGIIMKPQALMCGPLFAVAYLMYIINGSPYMNAKLKQGTARLFGFKTDSIALRLTETVLAVISAFAVIILVSVPFTGNQSTFWLVEKYYGTATSYEYATVNAYNFWALIGANWKKVDVPFLGLTYGKWGTIGMVVSILSSLILYVYAVKKHKMCKGALPLSMAFMLAGIFTFGHYMHERYIFPALPLLMFAYIFYNDRRILCTYIAYSATMLVNCIAAFYYSKLFEYGLYWDTNIIFWCSVANMVIFVFFTYLVIDLCVRNKPLKGYNG